MGKGRFFLDNHGCAKNQVDGEEIAARLEAAGFAWSDSAEGADILIVNSCGFVDDAKKESIDAVLAWKGAYPGKKVILAGCLAQRYAEALAADLPEADGIVGNADLADVLAAAEAVSAGQRPVLVERPESAPAPSGFRRSRILDFPGTAHLKITEGCSNRCTYCAIPLIRGGLRSRSVSDIVDEATYLVGQGAKELVLIGQDLGAFGLDLGGGALLPELFSALLKVKGDFRVRTLYIHPDNFPHGILPLIRDNPRLLPYFDLPFQHASPTLLRAMNRRGSPEVYLDLINTIRSTLGEAVVRSTFLVGFPGETEADFQILRDFQEAATLDWMGAFTYSREEGTPAYNLKARVPKKLALARKQAVEEAQVAITAKRLARFVGQDLEVLVEERVSLGEGEEAEGGEELSLGRAWLQAPEVDGLVVLRGDFEPGAMVKATVHAVNGVDLDCIPVADSRAASKG